MRILCKITLPNPMRILCKITVPNPMRILCKITVPKSAEGLTIQLHKIRSAHFIILLGQGCKKTQFRRIRNVNEAIMDRGLSTTGRFGQEPKKVCGK